MNLEESIPPGGRGYLPKAEAHKSLVYHTGQDFGDYAVAWRRWISDHRESFRNKTSQTTKNRFVSFIDEDGESSLD